MDENDTPLLQWLNVKRLKNHTQTSWSMCRVFMKKAPSDTNVLSAQKCWILNQVCSTTRQTTRGKLMTYLKISFTLQKFFFSFSFYYFDSTVLSPFLFCKLNRIRSAVGLRLWKSCSGPKTRIGHLRFAQAQLSIWVCLIPIKATTKSALKS